MELFKDWRNSITFTSTGDEARCSILYPLIPHLISIVAVEPTMNYNCPAWMLHEHELTFRYLSE